jgi:hypothetical protein
MLERSVDKKFTKGLKVMGLHSIKLSSFGARGEAGWPDRLVLGPYGVAVFVELKAPGNEPSPLQAARLAVLNTLGFPACWFDDAVSALAWVKNQVEGHVLADYRERTNGGGKTCKHPLNCITRDPDSLGVVCTACGAKTLKFCDSEADYAKCHQ